MTPAYDNGAKAYGAFLASKRLLVTAKGPQIDLSEVHGQLYPFQRQLVQWAVHKGRTALFCDTGLGKTLIQLEWARQIGERTLIVAPLMVAQQTVAEGAIIPCAWARLSRARGRDSPLQNGGRLPVVTEGPRIDRNKRTSFCACSRIPRDEPS
jgi:hypothetical protein